MDKTLLGVLIGSLIPIIGHLVQAWVAAQKERREWTRKQEADWEARQYDDEKAGLDERREAYENALVALTALRRSKIEHNQPLTPDSPEFELVKEVHKWLAKIRVRSPYSSLSDEMEAFMRAPHTFSDNLHKLVVAMAKQDTERALHIHTEPPPNGAAQLDNRSYEATFAIDPEYRQRRFAEGVALPRKASVRFALSDLSASQRKLLGSYYLVNFDTLPRSVQLYLPLRHTNGEVLRDGQLWRAKLDPSPQNRAALFAAWESDYQHALADSAES